MPQPSVHIPKPCPVSQEALAPTAAGWHCARCQTEVIDFTRLSEAEVLAYLAGHRGQRVCAAILAPLVPQPYQRPRGPRRWLLAAAALLGWHSADALPPLPPSPPPCSAAATRHTRVTISGLVLDDSLNVPLRGAFVFVKGTKYGAVTNEKGEFSFSFSPDWKPAETGELSLEVSASHFTFQPQLVTVSLKENPAPAPLTVRLLSLPQRGFIKGKAALIAPPVPPPGSHKSQP